MPVDWPHPSKASLPSTGTDLLRAKFEVFIFSRYKDMNGDGKCRNRVIWSGQGLLKVISACDFYSTSIETNLCVYFVPFTRYSELFVESRQLYLPHRHLAPLYIRGDSGRISPRSLARKNQSSWTGLSCCVITVILYLVVLVKHRIVTDQQTDTQTQVRSIFAITFCNKNKTVQHIPRQNSVARYKVKNKNREQIIYLFKVLFLNC